MFGAVKLTINNDLDKYRYSWYGTEFNKRSQFSWLNGSWGKNSVIFGLDISSPVHVDNKTKDILLFNQGPTQY